MRNKFWVLFALAFCLLVLCTAGALADYEVNGKTINVSGGDTAIQEALDKINSYEDKTGYTLVVAKGEYNRFVVPRGCDNTTIRGENEVVISVLDGSAFSSNTDTVTDCYGITVNAGNLTLENLTFEIGTKKNGLWCASAIAISNGKTTMEHANGLTVNECVFIGSGVGYGVFADNKVGELTITKCEFDNIEQALYSENAAGYFKDVVIENNTFTDCSFAIHASYANSEDIGNNGVFKFSNNIVTGGDDVFCKFILQDTAFKDSTKIEAAGNVFANAIFGTVNLREDGGTAAELQGKNTFSVNSCFVEAIEPGTIQFYTMYCAPEGTMGYWKLTGIDDFDVDWGKNPDGSTAFIQDIIDKANAAGSNELVLTGIDEDNLIKTFTWFKDGIYWYDEVGAIRVAKTVSGKKTDEKFTFTITLSDKTINGTYGDMTFKNGVATIELVDGQSAQAINLPVGISYTVTEEVVEAYTTTSENSTGTIRKNETAKCKFTNTEVVADLPKTGDNSTMLPWALLVLLCGAVLLGLRKARC